jgi:hypothetical protein
MGGLIADTSAWNVAGVALGAGGFQFGTVGTAAGISSALTDDGKG